MIVRQNHREHINGHNARLSNVKADGAYSCTSALKG
jgi:hypothetical protein